MTKEVLKDWRLYVFGGLFLFNLFYVLAFVAPRGFPEGSIVTVSRGTGLSELAHDLEEQKVVRSAFWFRAVSILLGGERGVQAGDYSLKERESSITIARRMMDGEHNIDTVKITIPEGYTNEEISKLFDDRFTNFEHDVFLALAEEGYMFPDTYFLQVNITAGRAIEIFMDNFERRVGSLGESLDTDEHSLEEIIIMASIIEAEVQTKEDKELVSGILWDRLEIGMPLQVDPAPETYKERGLPDRPINNPGLVSIRAALNPTKSPYLYFLSGKDGKTYYARTLEEHTKNIRERL
jgi:UPF0755 protein